MMDIDEIKKLATDVFADLADSIKVGAGLFDAAGIVAPPLADQGVWKPADEYWGDDGEPLAPWAVELVNFGDRPMMELRTTRPGDEGEVCADLLFHAAGLFEEGETAEALELVVACLCADPANVEAWFAAGSAFFEHDPAFAMGSYRVGAAIGDLAAGGGTDKVLAWDMHGNRPFLRCLHGEALCAWRCGETEAAAEIFARMLWLNPGDNLGIRYLLEPCQEGAAWEDVQED